MAAHRELWRDPDYRALFEADEEPVAVPQPVAAIGAGA
jgi:hypothetical protein